MTDYLHPQELSNIIRKLLEHLESGLHKARVGDMHEWFDWQMDVLWKDSIFLKICEEIAFIVEDPQMGTGFEGDWSWDDDYIKDVHREIGKREGKGEKIYTARWSDWFFYFIGDLKNLKGQLKSLNSELFEDKVHDLPKVLDESP